jgi:hypothetical protein
VVRLVPRVEREEFLNVGVILYCLSRGFLGAKVELDEARVRAFAPDLDLEEVRGHLESLPRVCAGGRAGGPIGRLSQKERFHWLVAPHSTILQAGPVHSGLCEEPAAALEHLMDRMVRPPAARR